MSRSKLRVREGSAGCKFAERIVTPLDIYRSYVIYLKGVKETGVKKIIKNLWKASTVYSYAALPFFAGAGQVLPAETETTIDIEEGALGQIGTFSVGQIISAFVSVLLIAAAVVFFFWLVLGGIKWIMSGGDKARVEGARDQVTHALIGLVIVFSAFAIARLVDVLFGVDIFNLTIKRIGT